MTGRPKDERGSALVVALVIVMLVGLVASALLAMQSTTIRGQSTLVDARETAFSGDGAIDTAIGLMRTVPEWGGDGEPCAGSVYPSPSLGKNVIVRCTPQPGSRALRGGPGRPAESVLVLLGGMAADGDDASESKPNPSRTFCDDFQSTDPRCEPGLFIGGGVNEPGGLLISSNGSPSGKPVVRSNGAIIVKTGDADRELLVEGGDVFARRGCTTSRVKAQYDPVSGAFDNDPAHLQCNVEDPPDGTIGSANRLMRPTDPDLFWRHGLWSATDRPTTAPSQLPGCSAPFTAPACFSSPVDRRLPWSDPANASLTVALSPTNPRGDVLTGLFSDCTDKGYVRFAPGRYDSLYGINYLMRNCPPTFYWFQPGVYYFDFTDLQTAGSLCSGCGEKWFEPRAFSQIVAGTRPTAARSAWNDCWSNAAAAAGGCVQPPHYMVSDKMVPSPASNWPNLVDTNIIDGEFGSVQWVGTAMESQLEQRKPRTPVPTGALVTSVKVRIAHTFAGDPAQWANIADMPGEKYPRLVVRLEGGGECRIPLRGGDPNSHIEEIDLTSSCQDSTGRAGVSASFPAPNWIAKPANESGAGNVNRIKMRYEARRASTSVTPTAAVDGMEIVVGYNGRPASEFPGACDVNGAGVQFIFGNRSAMIFQDNDVYAEICASPYGDPHGIGIYGLSGVTTPLPRQYDSAYSRDFSPGTGWLQFTPGPATAPDAPDTYELADGIFGSAAWSANSDAVLALKVPDGLFPQGTTIERMRLEVTHREPVGAENFTLRARVVPGSTAGDPAFSTGDRGASAFSIDSTKNTGGVDFLNQSTEWRTDVYGDNWPAERQLTDAINQGVSLNGATVYVEAINGLLGERPKAIDVDSVRLVVDYRPPGSLRPLAGCLTIRPQLDPIANDMVGVDFNQRDNASDASYYLPSSDKNRDTEFCALLRFWSASSAEGAKLHVVGSVYAPTAAIALSGKDNEVPFVADGIIVRHLSAQRWKQGSYRSALGGGFDLWYEPREVVLDAWVDENDNGVIDDGDTLESRARVRFTDWVNQALVDDPAVDILCWLPRSPSNAVPPYGGSGC